MPRLKILSLCNNKLIKLDDNNRIGSNGCKWLAKMALQ